MVDNYTHRVCLKSSGRPDSFLIEKQSFLLLLDFEMERHVVYGTRNVSIVRLYFVLTNCSKSISTPYYFEGKRKGWCHGFVTEEIR